MRCPKKLYLVVSRNSKGRAYADEVYFKRGDAADEADDRNTIWELDGEPADWRVETFVKVD